jgi:hypothetical protein
MTVDCIKEGNKIGYKKATHTDKKENQIFTIQYIRKFFRMEQFQFFFISALSYFLTLYCMYTS